MCVFPYFNAARRDTFGETNDKRYWAENIIILTLRPPSLYRRLIFFFNLIDFKKNVSEVNIIYRRWEVVSGFSGILPDVYNQNITMASLKNMQHR